MRSNHHRLLLLTVPVLAWAWETAAQVPVVEAGGAQGASSRAGQLTQPAPNSNNNPNSPTPGNQVLVELYMQLDALQREVQNLRGIVEEQSYRIQRMEAEQRDRYLDLDRRLSGLSGGDTTIGSTFPPASGTNGPGAGRAGGDNGAAGSQAGTAPGRNAGEPGVPAPQSPVSTPQGEQELYRTALNLLLEQGQFEESVSLFQQYIASYPQGTWAVNAWYWLGEALILLERYNEAGDAFMKVMNDYPNDPKAPGAMLKLGVVYNRMGDAQMARQLWQRISQEYPESTSEIRLAQDYLNRAN